MIPIHCAELCIYNIIIRATTKDIYKEIPSKPIQISQNEILKRVPIANRKAEKKKKTEIANRKKSKMTHISADISIIKLNVNNLKYTN